jgi:hypothetical protein
LPFAQAQETRAAQQKADVPSLLQKMTNGGHGFKSPIVDNLLKHPLNPTCAQSQRSSPTR